MFEQRFLELSSLVKNVSRETLADLEAYEKILIQWQGRINLIAKTTLSDIWQRHILDSVQLFPLACPQQNEVKNWLDVGSGSGFPGLVLAILAKHRGSGHVTLIESNGKKAAFLRMVAANLRLPVQVLSQRIETSSSIITVLPDIITARAVASLPELLCLIAPFFGVQTLALLPKGRGSLQEIEQAQRDWQFDLTRYPSKTEKQASILAIRNLWPRSIS